MLLVLALVVKQSGDACGENDCDEDDIGHGEVQGDDCDDDAGGEGDLVATDLCHAVADLFGELIGFVGGVGVLIVHGGFLLGHILPQRRRDRQRD